MENYEKDYNILREHVPLLPKYDKKYRMNKSKCRHFQYTYQIKELVYEAFKDDFIKLGYEK